MRTIKSIGTVLLFLLAVAVVQQTLVTTALGGPPTPIDLPTMPEHTGYTIHHDLVAPAPPGTNVTLNAFPGQGSTTGLIGFVDGLVSTNLWHLEFELEGGAAGNAAGNLIVVLPDGQGWTIPHGALGPGATFTVAYSDPVVHDHDELAAAEPWFQEARGWQINYTNLTPAAILVDGGISELPEDRIEGHVDLQASQYDFYDFNYSTDETTVVIQLTGPHPIPSHTNLGLLILTALLLLSGLYVAYKRRQAVGDVQ